MADKIQELVDYVQIRCLWQFHSRSWDREENIENILKQMAEILSGHKPQATTPTERCYFANANRLANEVKTALPWMTELGSEELESTVAGAIAKLHQITIDGSLNGELQQPLY